MGAEDQNELSVPALPTFYAVNVPKPWFANGMVSPEMAGEIFNWLSRGRTLSAFCACDGAPSLGVVQRWVETDPEFAAMYRDARRIGHEALLEETLAIADTRNPDDGMDIAHRKLRIDTRIKVLEKLDPERYGDKKKTETNTAVQIIVTTGVPQPEAAAPKITAKEVQE